MGRFDSSAYLFIFVKQFFFEKTRMLGFGNARNGMFESLGLDKYRNTAWCGITKSIPQYHGIQDAVFAVSIKLQEIRKLQ